MQFSLELNGIASADTFWNMMYLLYLYTLFLFRGLFNTGLTVFPDFSSVRSDDMNFILWVAVTSQLMTLTHWSILGWRFLRSISSLRTNTAVAKAVVSFPGALHTHEDEWLLLCKENSQASIIFWLSQRKMKGRLREKRETRGAASLWSQIWGTPALTRHFSILN